MLPAALTAIIRMLSRMQTVLPWIAFAAGLFYAAGAIAVMRRMAMDTLLDKAIAALTLKRNPIEETATRILTMGAMLTFASGIALMALSRAAIIFFVLNILLQTGHLAWSAWTRPAGDVLEQKGRQSMLNALLIYIGVFGLVLLIEQGGLWRSWFGAAPWGLPAEFAAAVLVTAGFGWAVMGPVHRRAAPQEAASAPCLDPPDTEAGLPECLRLMPEYGCWPLWGDTQASNIDPQSLGFSDGLIERINDWDALFQNGYRKDDPLASGFGDLAEERRWAAESHAVAAAIEAEWPGRFVNKCSRLPWLVAHAHEGLGDYDRPPEERVVEQARFCGVLEIHDILTTLDRLARERAALPAWDGDGADDIADAQQFYARLLQHADAKYRPDIETGLESSETETRDWVRLALDGKAG